MTDKKAIIAGGGELPGIIANSLKEQNIPYYVIAIRGDYNLSSLAPDVIVDIGLVGTILKTLEQESIKEIIFAGSIKRPSFAVLKLDGEGIKLIAQITKSKILGDNNILSTIVKFLENKNYKIISADDIISKILTTIGALGKIKPSDNDLKDIEIGKQIALAIGDLDIGQGAIIENRLVLGIEAVEGTDELIKRCAFLKKESNAQGVLVKMKKPNQERKIDLPSIGITTIINIAEAGFSGIALEAGHSFIIDKEATIREADLRGIFIIGI